MFNPRWQLTMTSLLGCRVHWPGEQAGSGGHGPRRKIERWYAVVCDAMLCTKGGGWHRKEHESGRLQPVAPAWRRVQGAVPGAAAAPRLPCAANWRPMHRKRRPTLVAIATIRALQRRCGGPDPYTSPFPLPPLSSLLFDRLDAGGRVAAVR